MAHAFAGLALGMAAAAAVGGCSALGLGRIPLPHCENDDQCEPLNVRYALRDRSCERFQCNEGAGICEHRAARDDDEDGDPTARCGGTDCDDISPLRFGNPALGGEECDGVDNDCDLVVDEAVIAGEAPVGLVSGLASTMRVALGESASERVVLGSIGTSEGRFGAVPGLAGPVAAATSIAYRQQDPGDGTSQWYNVPGTTPGCAGGVACSFRDAAVASTGRDGEWFVASVSTGGCASGQMRIGWSPSAVPAFELRGPTVRSNLFAGFDLTAAGCNGEGRAGGGPGAARPAAAAALPPSGVPQAFVTWLGDTVDRADCGGIPAPVEGLTVWLESGLATGTSISWVTGSNDAEPIVLGMTDGGGAPAVLALPAAAGFLVGFGTSGGVALRRVPISAEPTPVATSPRPAPDSSRPTPAVDFVDEGLITASGADHVAFALSSASGSVGVAWMTGCGTGTSTVSFAAVDIDGLVPSAPVTLSAGRATRGPVLAYLSAPQALVGYAPSGGAPLTANAAGWLVLWLEEGGDLMARRVLEGTNVVLDSAPFQVTSGVASDFDLLAPAADGTAPAVATYLAGDVLTGVPVCGTAD